MKNKFFLALLTLAAVLAVTLGIRAVNQQPVFGNGFLLIQSGASVTSTGGLITNTFTTAYSSLPAISVSQVQAVGTATNLITAVTTTNFIYSSGTVGTSNNWVAVGSP